MAAAGRGRARGQRAGGARAPPRRHGGALHSSTRSARAKKSRSTHTFPRRCEVDFRFIVPDRPTRPPARGRFRPGSVRPTDPVRPVSGRFRGSEILGDHNLSENLRVSDPVSDPDRPFRPSRNGPTERPFLGDPENVKSKIKFATPTQTIFLSPPPATR